MLIRVVFVRRLLAAFTAPAGKWLLALTLCLVSTGSLSFQNWEDGEVPSPTAFRDATPIVIGLDADLSSGSAQAGQAILRGILVAIDEINAQGGVLGRPLEVVAKDHRGNPARGRDNIVAFSELENIIAVVGGLHTPVVLYELDVIHEHKLLFLVPWAAGTRIVANGFTPNFVFRISVRDEFAGHFLAKKVLEFGHRHPGLVMERTTWGRSNEIAIKTALSIRGIHAVDTQWFNWGVEDLTPAIDRLAAKGVDVMLLVANAPEGLAAIRSMAKRVGEVRLPILSHWGITGGDFFKLAASHLQKVQLCILQTFSFVDPPHPDRATRFFRTYQKLYPEAKTPESIISAAGTAHAYDSVHLLSMAVRSAGTTDRTVIRDALERLEAYSGLVRDYAPAFTEDRHEALSVEDYRLMHYGPYGILIPCAMQ